MQRKLAQLTGGHRFLMKGGSNSLTVTPTVLIHQLTALLLFTLEGNPASSIQKTQIPLALFLRFIFSIETQTHSPFPFPENHPPPSRYLTGISLVFWRRAAANRNVLCQIGRIPLSEKKLILWWVPPQNRGA